jgi:hypothetical protein
VRPLQASSCACVVAALVFAAGCSQQVGEPSTEQQSQLGTSGGSTTVSGLPGITGAHVGIVVQRVNISTLTCPTLTVDGIAIPGDTAAAYATWTDSWTWWSGTSFAPSAQVVLTTQMGEADATAVLARNSFYCLYFQRHGSPVGDLAPAARAAFGRTYGTIDPVYTGAYYPMTPGDPTHPQCPSCGPAPAPAPGGS